MKKTCLKIIVFFLFIFLFVSSESKASTKLNGIENFPDSYKPYLYALKTKYPNQEFTALYTGLDWNTVIANEYKNDKNLVPISYSNRWKYKDEGIYNIEIKSGWVNDSKQKIKYKRYKIQTSIKRPISLNILFNMIISFLFYYVLFLFYHQIDQTAGDIDFFNDFFVL